MSYKGYPAGKYFAKKMAKRVSYSMARGGSKKTRTIKFPDEFIAKWTLISMIAGFIMFFLGKITDLDLFYVLSIVPLFIGAVGSIICFFQTI